MTLIEICVLICTVFWVVEKLAATAASIKTVKTLNQAKDEFEQLKASLGLGATIGGAAGVLVAGIFKKFVDKKGTTDARSDSGDDAKREDQPGRAAGQGVPTAGQAGGGADAGGLGQQG